MLTQITYFLLIKSKLVQWFKRYFKRCLSGYGYTARRVRSTWIRIFPQKTQCQFFLQPLIALHSLYACEEVKNTQKGTIMGAYYMV